MINSLGKLRICSVDLLFIEEHLHSAIVAYEHHSKF